jgi:hypothetical protein
MIAMTIMMMMIKLMIDDDDLFLFTGKSYLLFAIYPNKPFTQIFDSQESTEKMCKEHNTRSNESKIRRRGKRRRNQFFLKNNLKFMIRPSKAIRVIFVCFLHLQRNNTTQHNTQGKSQALRE